MTDKKEIKVPDMGGATQVDVIEVLVKVGDKVDANTSLITLESDKASMEIPASAEGIVESIQIKVGDKVSTGDLILTLASTAHDSPEGDKIDSKKEETESKPKAKELQSMKPEPSKVMTEKKEIKVPDIGGATGVDVIEVQVKEGDLIDENTSLITLESDKASMEIPALVKGTVESIHVKVGDKVSEGDLILTMASSTAAVPQEKEMSKPTPKESPAQVENKTTTKAVSQTEKLSDESSVDVAAGPGVRRMARELGVDLAMVKGTGRKSRISKEDLAQYVKMKLQQPGGSGGFSISPAPEIDFTKFGEVDIKSLNKIKRLTGTHVHRSWVTIPHVTQFDEADITQLEAFRKSELEAAKAQGIKLTLLAFVCKAIYKALMAFPQFNASLDPKGDQLIFKKYYNIGIAVETPNGLVVPVIKQVDQLSITEIAKEMARVSLQAREKGLSPSDMSGGCFTISSLGGIGGTAFTPIVNSPEVAILGLSKAMIKPIYQGDTFQPRLMLPLSLSYDHRVIDGAEAARFTRFVSELLGDIRRILL